MSPRTATSVALIISTGVVSDLGCLDHLTTIVPSSEMQSMEQPMLDAKPVPLEIRTARADAPDNLISFPLKHVSGLAYSLKRRFAEISNPWCRQHRFSDARCLTAAQTRMDADYWTVV